MDAALRCNSLNCRVHLTERAVVTTCSHIFCVPCSEPLQLSNTNGGNVRVCPACQTQLTNPDDAVVAQLNPTEDYKTSVLSGLSPSIIMECAGRGLSFYAYQTSQEIVYQEHVARGFKEKYSTLSTQMDNIIHEANTEITALREKLSGMHIERKNLEQKNHDLQKAFREKARNQQQLSRMYQTLKQQQVAAGMELAAEQTVEQTLHGLGRSSNLNGNPRIQSPAKSNGSDGSGGKRYMRQKGLGDEMQDDRGNIHLSYPAPLNLGHQTPLPVQTNPRSVDVRLSRAGSIHHSMSHRPPMNQVDPNITFGISDSAGYGLPTDVKIGHQRRGVQGLSGR